MSPSPAFRSDRRPTLVICICEADHNAWDPVEELGGQPWSPGGARTVAIAADQPLALLASLRRHMALPDCQGVLLVGRTHHDEDFRVQMRAGNRTFDGGAKLAPTGPSTARATASVTEMIRELNAAGLAATASSRIETDVENWLLYSILTELPDDRDAPAVGLLRVPAQVPAGDLDRGIRAAATAIARHLTPLPRAITA